MWVLPPKVPWAFLGYSLVHPARRIEPVGRRRHLFQEMRQGLQVENPGAARQLEPGEFEGLFDHP